MYLAQKMRKMNYFYSIKIKISDNNFFFSFFEISFEIKNTLYIFVVN